MGLLMKLRSRIISGWALLCVVCLFGCGAREPIQIGFVSELTGRNAGLGLQGRNAAQLAIQKINAQGGVEGRSLELVVRDTRGNPRLVANFDRELLDSGVSILTGHMTSWEIEAALPMLEGRPAVLFSPTASSPNYTGIADSFFRLSPASTIQTTLMAEYTYQQLGLRRAAVIYDQSNLSYARTFGEDFADHFSSLGGQVLTVTHFSDSALSDLVAEIYRAEPDVVLIVASGFNTAVIAQQIRLLDWPVQLLASNWALTNDLLQNGGRVVENMILPTHFDQGCQTPAYLDFRSEYESAYGHAPTFAAVFAYETIWAIRDGLEQTQGQMETLGQVLSVPRSVAGLCDKIFLDEFGDATRTLYLVSVAGNEFQVVQVIHP